VKTLILIAIFAAGAFGQCVDRPNDPCVPVNQSVVDRSVAEELFCYITKRLTASNRLVDGRRFLVSADCAGTSHKLKIKKRPDSPSYRKTDEAADAS